MAGAGITGIAPALGAQAAVAKGLGLWKHRRRWALRDNGATCLHKPPRRRRLALSGAVACAALSLIGCGKSSQPPAQTGLCSPKPHPDDAKLLSELPKPEFFPKEWARQGTWCSGRCAPRLSPFVMAWYSQHLAASGEPSLYAASRSGQAGVRQIRFTWLPTFHHPATVRVLITGNEYRLIARELSGMGGYEPGTTGKSLDRLLAQPEKEQIDNALASDLFSADPEECMVGIDGARWIFESAQSGNYKFGERFSPSKGPIRDAGLTMLKLTGWQFAEIY